MTTTIDINALRDARTRRTHLESQAILLFTLLLKLERGRRSQVLKPARAQEQVALRIKTIESQILKIRRELRVHGVV